MNDRLVSTCIHRSKRDTEITVTSVVCGSYLISSITYIYEKAEIFVSRQAYDNERLERRYNDQLGLAEACNST